MKLVSAHIIRDGGSLTALFRRDDGSLVSLHLQIGPDGLQSPPPHYRELTVSSEAGRDESSIVLRGGEVEALMFADLDHWLAEPRFSDDWSDGVNEHARMIERVVELRQGAAGRIDSPPGVHERAAQAKAELMEDAEARLRADTEFARAVVRRWTED